MGRPRLTDEEREARRKERSRKSFSDAGFRHYDTSEGFGSADEWIGIAEAVAEGLGFLFTRPSAGKRIDPDLAILNLDKMPDTIAGLKTAFRKVMQVVHPDHGGTNEACRKALEAFSRLTKHYQKDKAT
jgi:hypothetical protein